MNKIKVIDLLNMISKGEEVPKRIRLFGDEFKIEDNEYYSVYTSELLISYFGEDYLRAELNDEIEILDEEEFEDIEELKLDGDFGGDFLINDEGNKCHISSHDKTIVRRINKVIKNQKKIIERIENEKSNNISS